MKSVMHSVVRCLVSSFFLLATFPAYSFTTEPEYIEGVGKTARAAIENLQVAVLEMSMKQVSSHTTLHNDNGRQNYNSVTAVDSGISLSISGIELTHSNGYWTARIEKGKVFQQEVNWVEQKITINNTYNETPTYSRGFVRNTSTTRTSRRTDIVGPSGRVVKTIPGGKTTKTVKTCWNGRYGYTYESVKNGR